jgi:phosphoglycolate phosphatase-like HAD superfamily hydrolase
MFAVGALWGFRTGAELLAAGAQILAEQPADLLRLFPLLQ